MPLDSMNREMDVEEESTEKPFRRPRAMGFWKLLRLTFVIDFVHVDPFRLLMAELKVSIMKSFLVFAQKLTRSDFHTLGE